MREDLRYNYNIKWARKELETALHSVHSIQAVYMQNNFI